MSKTNKACWNCGNFGALYKKGYYHFYKTDLGTCSILKEVIDKHGYCERWRNTFHLRSIRKAQTLKALDEILSDITAIKQILEEEKEESRTQGVY